jgi:hypothetical protein
VTPAWAWRAAALAVALAGAPASAQLGADAQKTYDDFQRLGPHRAYALAADGKGYLWAGASGADPGRAVEGVLKACEERSKSRCSLYAVNNVVLAAATGRKRRRRSCRRSAGCGRNPIGRTRARRPPPA